MKATIAFLILASALEVQLLAQTCSSVSMRLESRSGYGQKQKVGFGSYDLNDPYRMFLKNDWTQTVKVTDYVHPIVPQTGSLDAVYSHSAYYEREDDFGDPIFNESTVNITASLSYPGFSGSSSYSGVITDPRPTALAYAEVLGSSEVHVWNWQLIFGAIKLFRLDWHISVDTEYTAPEVRTATEWWFDRRTLTLTSPDPESGSQYGPDYHSNLSSEYTTGMLIADARRRATNAIASTWSAVFNPTAATLTSTLTLANHDRTAAADVTVWRATLDHGDYGQTYEVRWLEWFIPEGGSPGKPALRRKSFPGTGVGSSVEVEVPLPSSPGTSVVRVLGAYPANRFSDDAGNGAPPDMVGRCCGGGGRGLGEGGPGARFSVSLGRDINGTNLGELDFSTAETGADTIARRNLRWVGRRQTAGSVEEYARPDGGLQQLVSDSLLVDVVQLSNGFEVRLYPPTARGAFLNQDEGYALLPGSIPYRVFRIANPDGTGANNRVMITQDPGAGERAWEYRRLSPTAWETRLPGTLASTHWQRVEETWVGNQRTVTTKIISVSGSTETVIDQRSMRYDLFPLVVNGAPVAELLIESSAGVGGLSKSTYAYYLPGEASWFEPVGGKAPIKQVIHPDGFWERFSYNPANGRMTQRLSGHASQGPTDSANLVEHELYDYSTSYLGDVGTMDPDAPRRVERYRLGTLIGRTWYGYWSDRTEEVRAISAAAIPTTAGNLKTVTHYETTGGIRRVIRIVHPDGLETRYTYPANGAPSPEYVDHGVVQAGAVVNGTRTRTEVDSLGRAFRTTRQDLQPGGTVITTDVIHHTAFDVQGRPTTTTYLDGEQVTRTYACCGLESETDRDGVTTTYGYDDAGRRISITRHGITHFDDLDAAGRVWRRRRVGTDSTEVILSTTTYDTAGRVLTQLNAGQGAATSVSWPATGTPGVRTTTHPTGAVSREETDYSGQVIRITGRAIRPVRYVHGVDGNGPFRR